VLVVPLAWVPDRTFAPSSPFFAVAWPHGPHSINQPQGWTERGSLSHSQLFCSFHHLRAFQDDFQDAMRRLVGSRRVHAPLIFARRDGSDPRAGAGESRTSSSRAEASQDRRPRRAQLVRERGQAVVLARLACGVAVSTTLGAVFAIVGAHRIAVAYDVRHAVS
jgi:hypothetical protein